MTDFDRVAEAISHPSFPDKLPLSAFHRDGKLYSWLERTCAVNASERSGVWAIDLQSGAQCIGQVALMAQDDRHMLSLWLSPAYWGQGYARESVAAVIEHSVAIGAGERIWAATGLWNASTARLLLSLDFTEGATLDQAYTVDGQGYAARQFWLSPKQQGAV